MIALDTNVVVRVLTADDPVQLRAARRLISSGATLFLSKSVLLETEWVLRYSYELNRVTIGDVLRQLIGAHEVEVEDLDAVRQALAWHAEGLDLADALHLASSRSADSFASFDRQLAARAARVGCLPVVELLR